MPCKFRPPSWALALLAIALVAGLVWLLRDGGAAAPVASAAAAKGPHFFDRIDSVAALPLPDGQGERRRQLLDNLQLADHTYCSYRNASQYPQGSRPVAEQPDQMRPNAPVTDVHAMRLDGGGSDQQVQIQTSQSRVFMAAGETVAFSVRALDAQGRVLPLVVTRAAAQGLVFKGGRPTAQVPLVFADDGQGADAVSGDGAFAAVLAPAQTGLASFNGTIRSEVKYSVGGRNGVVLFDVIYSPETPAVWTGQVREAVENGSLNFYLKAEVRQAGRYIVSARVDDTRGRPFALLTFNDLLAVGTQEVKLTVFGKLMRDGEAALPLTLRDVDGYLLKENADPDRALMPRLEGKAYVSKPHALKSFSDAEWQSEARSRYLDEFARDLSAARAAMKAFDPASPLPKSACVENLN